MRALLPALVSLGVLAGCRAERRACSPHDPCVGAAACVAGRCEPKAKRAALYDSERRVLLPRATLHEGPGDDERLVLRGGRGSWLLLDFDWSQVPAERVVEAHLVLRSVEPGPRGLARLRVAPMQSPWDARSTPPASVPAAIGVEAASWSLRPDPGERVRLDVSRLIRAAAAPHGLAVWLDGEGGAAFATPGALESPHDGPRLELYLRE